MNIKRNIIFSLESRKKNGVTVTDNIPIRMRVIYNGTRIDFSTGYRIDTSKWDNEKQRVKNGCINKLKQNASEINTDLLRSYMEVQNIFKEFEVKGIAPTPKQVKEAFKTKYKTLPDTETKPGNDEVSLMNVFDEFVKECGKQNNWTHATHEKFATVKKYLVKFNPEISFTCFEAAGLNEYVCFLQEVKKLRNSTVSRQIGFLKWFLRWSLKKGYNHNDAFESFRPKLKSTQKKVIFLTMNELNLLRTYQIHETKEYLEPVRDVFLFCCFTGLRYSDVYNLKRSDIKDSHIEITTVKTSENLVIELNNHSKAILDKYRDVVFKDEKVLPVISNQRMNDYIKELGRLAEINEPVRETYYKGNRRIDEITPKYALLGTHAGRRTFICNALSLGIPPQVVMKWTGHSDYKAMKPYIDIADDIKASAMEKFNQL